MEASQASGSNTMGLSASAMVDDKAVPGHSFLVTLRCPQPATITRKWKVAINPPPREKRKSAARGTSISQFPMAVYHIQYLQEYFETYW